MMGIFSPKLQHWRYLKQSISISHFINSLLGQFYLQDELYTYIVILTNNIMSDFQYKKKKKLTPLNDSYLTSIQNINQTTKNDQPQNSNPSSNNSKKLHFVLFWLFMLSGFLLCYQNFIFFLFADDLLNMAVGIPIVIFSFTIQILVSCKMTETKWEMFQLYILLDNIFVALAAALVGFVGMLNIIFGNMEPIYLVLIIILCLSYTFFTGSFRVILAKCKFPRYQVISAKIILLVDCLAYLILATYYMQNPVPEREDSGSQEDIKNFFFLYVFGFFTLIVEIYGKFTDLDGTGQLKFNYVIGDQDDEQNQQLSNDQNNGNKKIHPQQLT